MKTRNLLLSAGLTIVMALLAQLYLNGQIYFEGFDANHEGGAAWDADGSGPEPAATGHQHPFGWGTSRYYGASRDYDGIDPDPEAAMAHLLEGMNGFPLFEQVLPNLGFSAEDVKIKVSLFTAENDLEGEDWFTFNSRHYFNKYDGQYTLVLDGEPMISGHFNYAFFSYDSAVYNLWLMETNFDHPWDASSFSSPPVQAAASVFLQDLSGEQLRMVFTNMSSPGSFFFGNGRVGGVFFDVQGYLEKGHAELPFVGAFYQHQGLAAWDADGTGPEPAATGHSFSFNGNGFWMPYYTASLDYGGIDPDPYAAMCHFLEGGKGFPNLETQLAYRGYTLDQLRAKAGLSILGNDEEGVDWGLCGPTHWWRSYGTSVSIEIDGEPILQCMIDTNYNTWYLDDPNLAWSSSSSLSPARDISGNTSPDAQYVALSILKDIGGQFPATYMEGHGVAPLTGNGRQGAIHQIDNGYLTLGSRSYGTTVWPGEVSGTWNAAGSPYMIEGEVIVPDGETLAVQPGTMLEFRGPFGIDVNGRFLAQGTDADVVFTHSNPAVWWDGIDFPETPATSDSSLFDHCLFEYGYAQGEEPYNSGGAIVVKDFDKLKFTNCIFQYNKADQQGANYNPCGGAIALWNSDPIFQNCIFRSNHSDTAAGALFAYEYSDPVISGCMFYENSSDFWAGAVGFYQNSGGILLNSTIADNTADYGGGIGFYDNSSPEVINSILWDNRALVEGAQVYINTITCTPGFYYCDIEGGRTEFGGVPFTGNYEFNIEEDPVFADSAGYAFYALGEGSPCIDAGTLELPAGVELPEFDLAGYPRVWDFIVDMGAYEFGPWVGVPPVGSRQSAVGSQMSVSPNPFSEGTSVSCELSGKKMVNISVYSIAGMKVRTLANTLGVPSDSQTIYWDGCDQDGNVLPAGLYIIRLTVDDKPEATVKVVKQ